MTTSRLIETADLRMHYLQKGTGDPVILIHGFPETSYEWRHQLGALSEHHAVFAPDMRGFGQTDKPGVRVTRQLLAQDVVNFMDALGLERAAIVGHDWGGIIAFKLAIDWPERVTRLALLDTLCTVWFPAGVHGYWFKAEPYPEEFFAKHHEGFIEAIFRGESSEALPGPPHSPWAGAGAGASPWASADDVAHYVQAFADPASHFHAISQYRYGLPFHIVRDDPSAPRGERYESLSESRVAEMWLHPAGLDKHPLYEHFMDYGPEDRHKRFEAPTLWMYASAMGRLADPADWREDHVPSGNPFFDQFPRYFPDLRVRTVEAGHFFPEEAPEATNKVLLPFLAGEL